MLYHQHRSNNHRRLIADHNQPPSIGHRSSSSIIDRSCSTMIIGRSGIDQGPSSLSVIDNRHRTSIFDDRPLSLGVRPTTIDRRMSSISIVVEQRSSTSACWIGWRARSWYNSDWLAVCRHITECPVRSRSSLRAPSSLSNTRRCRTCNLQRGTCHGCPNMELLRSRQMPTSPSRPRLVRFDQIAGAH